MRIIAKRTLKEFWEKHTDCEQALLSWDRVVKSAKWENFEDVKQQFGSCKILGQDRIIFKIKGNRYRLVVKVSFTNKIIWIRFIGTHPEYDSINAKEI